MGHHHHHYRRKYFSRNLIAIIIILGIVLGIAYFTIGLKFNDTLLTLGSSEDELPCEDDIYDALSKEEQINAYGNTYRILEWGNFTNREEAFNYFENKWDINILGFTSEIPVNIN